MSFVSYEATGGQTTFTIPFDYLRSSHLTVTLRGSTLTPGTNWTISGGNVVLSGVTVNEDDVVTITRSTPSDSLVAGFANPGSVRAFEINAVALQLLYILQESLSLVQNAMQKNGAGTAWLGEGLELTNLASPTADSSAATRGYVTNVIASSGEFPEPELSNVGEGIRVFNVGGEATLGYGGIDGAFAVLRSPFVSSGAVTGAIGGYDLYKRNGPSPVAWTDTEIPVEIVNSFGTPSADEAIAVTGGDGIYLPEGTWEITVEGYVRKLTNAASLPSSTSHYAYGSIRSDNLSTEYAASPIVQLSQDNSTTAQAMQRSAFFQMKGYATLGTGAAIHICIAAGDASNTENVVLDYPSRITVREILL